MADVDINELLRFHESQNVLATVTATPAPSRFGALKLHDEKVEGFQEKPMGEGSWINGGFFVLSPKVLSLIEDDSTVWERGPMEHLAATGQMNAYRHAGFWQAHGYPSREEPAGVALGFGKSSLESLGLEGSAANHQVDHKQ